VWLNRSGSLDGWRWILLSLACQDQLDPWENAVGKVAVSAVNTPRCYHEFD
jgi:hypothetical protein